jgi:hypothetical protein
VKFFQRDLFKTDFHEADVLTLYLLPDVNLALRPKILAELKAGARVVSHDYGMGDWRPDAEETIPAPDKKVGVRKESQVYLWTVPAQIGGEWTLDVTANGETRRMRLSLKQRYQFVSGSVNASGKAVAKLNDAKLHGDELQLLLPAGVADREPVRLIGRVTGNAAGGTTRSAGGIDGTWSARRGS